MRFLFGALMIGSMLWGGYWFIGSSGANAAFAAWFDARRAEGWVADYTDLTVKGFPNRFDATFTDIALADPDTGWAWNAPFFQILALSYRPNHVIAVWPNSQSIATPNDTFTLQSDGLRASLVVAPQSDLALERMTLTGETLTTQARGDTQITTLTALTLAAERLADTTDYRLGFVADGYAPRLDWLRQVDPNRTLPAMLDTVALDMTVTFDRPWDLRAIEDTRPQPRAIHLKKAEARWGKLSLAAAGELRIDASGQPRGTLTIKARNWRDILDIARASGSLPDAFADPVETGLSLLSQLAGNPKTLDVPLVFKSGKIWLGPVPIAPVPDLHLR